MPLWHLALISSGKKKSEMSEAVGQKLCGKVDLLPRKKIFVFSIFGFHHHPIPRVPSYCNETTFRLDQLILISYMVEWSPCRTMKMAASVKSRRFGLLSHFVGHFAQFVNNCAQEG